MFEEILFLFFSVPNLFIYNIQSLLSPLGLVQMSLSNGIEKIFGSYLFGMGEEITSKIDLDEIR